MGNLLPPACTSIGKLATSTGHTIDKGKERHMLDMAGRLLTKRFFHRPIFIVGLGRSGTTALFSGLIKHPQVIGAQFEYPFMGYLSRIPYVYEFGDHHDWLLHSLSVPKSYLYQQLRRVAFEVAVGKQYGLKTLMRNMMRGDWHLLAKRFWCAKTFLAYDAYQGVMQLYPEAKFVYILRNGCEVVQSRTKFKSFAQRDFETHCREWAESIGQYRYLLEVENGVRIYQEDLISNPESVYEKVFDLVGLPPHDAPSRFVRSTLIHPLDETTKHDIDVKEVLTARPPAHADWNAEQRSIFKDICSQAMQEAGYEMPF